MSTRTDPWPAGTPCWVDLSVPDLQSAVDFYADVIGWTFVDSGPEYGNYHIAQVDGRAAAGIGPIMQEGQPAAWTVYLASDDVDADAVGRVPRVDRETHARMDGHSSPRRSGGDPPTAGR